jgi:hypothetical protein
MSPLTRGATVLSSRKISESFLTGFCAVCTVHTVQKRKRKPTYHNNLPENLKNDLILLFNYHPLNNRHINITSGIFITMHSPPSSRSRCLTVKHKFRSFCQPSSTLPWVLCLVLLFLLC